MIIFMVIFLVLFIIFIFWLFFYILYSQNKNKKYDFLIFYNHNDLIEEKDFQKFICFVKSLNHSVHINNNNTE